MQRLNGLGGKVDTKKILGIALIMVSLFTSGIVFAWTEELNTGLKAYYKFDGNGNDVMGTHNLTNGTVTYNTTDCKYGSCVMNSYIYGQGNFVDIDFSGGSSISLCGWFFGSGTASQGVFAICNKTGFGAEDDACFWMDHSSSGTTYYSMIQSSGWSHTIARAGWQFMCAILNSTGLSEFKNGAYVNIQPMSGMANRSAKSILFGAHTESGTSGWSGRIDDVGIWQRVLTPAEVSSLYNGGSGLTWEEITYPISVSVTLNTPVDDYNTTSSAIILNSTGTVTNGNLTNATLYVWNGGTFSNSTDRTGTTNTTYLSKSGLTDGTYKWNVNYCGSNSTTVFCNFSATNRTFTVDRTLPVIRIKYPLSANYNVNVSEINYTVSDTHTGSCWYSVDGGETNSTASDYGTNFTDVASVENNNTWTLYCNDSFGNLNKTSVLFYQDTLFPLIDFDTSPDGEVQGYNSVPITIESCDLSAGGCNDFYLNTSIWFYNESLISIVENISNDDTNKFFYNFTGLTDGTYFFNSTACDLLGNCNYTGTRNVTIDTIYPSVKIVIPLNGTVYYTLNSALTVEVNTTISDTHLDSCWYFNETGNTTLTCGSNDTVSVGEGYHTFIVYANDSANNIRQNATTFFVDYIKPAVYFSSFVLEGENTTFLFNLTGTSLSSTGNATLKYNNAYYPMTNISSNSTTQSFIKVITTPLVDEDTNVTFNVTYSVYGNNFTTNNRGHIVYNLTGLIFSNDTCSDAGYQFVIKNEVNSTIQLGIINYNFKFGASNSSSLTYYGSVSGVVSDLFLCYNATIYPNLTIGSGEIKYSVTDYSDRYYYIFNDVVMNNNTFQNISLYSLESALSTSFLFTVQTNTMVPLSNRYISLLRWYPDENVYKTVEMSRTDEKGQTIMRLKTEDVYYRYGIYELNGTLIKLTEPVKMVCQTNPCTYTIYVSSDPIDLTSIFGLQQNLSFNNNTGIFTYIWNDPSQKTQTMNLSVFKINGTAEKVICSTAGTGAVGVITCNVAGQNGTMRGEVWRQASPETPVAQKTVTVGITRFADSRSGKLLGLMFGVILVIIFAMVGIFNPIIAIILSLIALIPLMITGNLTWEIIGGLAVIGGIVIHFMRKVQ